MKEPQGLMETLIGGYQWAVLFMLGVLAWAGKELYGVVITRQFDALRAEMSTDREESRKRSELLRTQNVELLTMISDMRVEIAKVSTKIEKNS